MVYNAQLGIASRIHRLPNQTLKNKDLIKTPSPPFPTELYSCIPSTHIYQMLSYNFESLKFMLNADKMPVLDLCDFIFDFFRPEHS